MRTAVHSISLYKSILVKILIFVIKLTFIETVFYILNRNLPLGMEVWPPGSLDINPFYYLKCSCSHFLSRLEKVVAAKDDFIH
jgi:hypothetical protein